MAKGNRKLTTSRSERLLGSYAGGYSNGHHAAGEPELGEEDVWSTIDDDGGRYDNRDHMNGSSSEWSSRSEFESNGGSMSTGRGGARRGGGGGGGWLSLAFEDSSTNAPSSEKIHVATETAASRIVHQFRGHERSEAGRATPSPRQVASSAPMNVPDWSKILRIDSVESLHEMSPGGGGFGDHDDSSDEMMPPHEYLAREYARGWKTGGASMFEGVGRTLKGRDLRRVRDAVWSQTGFNG